MATLPAVVPFVFLPLFQQFRLKSRRAQLEAGLGSFITGGEQPFRQTTREEIITGGRNRGLFNDPEGAEIPEEQLTP